MTDDQDTGGFIKLHRSILDHVFWKDKPFNRKDAWIDLILLASYKRRELLIKGTLIKLDRGQLAWSQKALSKRWGWSRGKVERFLSLLTSQSMAEQKPSIKPYHLPSIITICKYDTYQDTQTPKQTPGRTGDGQVTDTSRTRIKNSKERKEEKEINKEKEKLRPVNAELMGFKGMARTFFESQYKIVWNEEEDAACQDIENKLRATFKNEDLNHSPKPKELFERFKSKIFRQLTDFEHDNGIDMKYLLRNFNKIYSRNNKSEKIEVIR